VDISAFDRAAGAYKTPKTRFFQQLFVSIVINVVICLYEKTHDCSAAIQKQICRTMIFIR